MKKILEIKKALQFLWKNKSLIIKLSINDIQNRYAGSVLGVIWAFVQPLITILVFWFIFQIGFKSPPVSDVEFILWFVAAYIPWIYFSDGIISATNCLYEYSYLVKKVKFKVELLPIIKILSATILHVFFIVMIIFMFVLYGYNFDVIWLNCIYYSFSLCILMVGLSWIVSSISVFIKDLAQLISVCMQIWFWITPIFWAPDQMSDQMLKYFKINPIYYIVNGYRSALISKVNFWEREAITIYYWGIVTIVFVMGWIIFRKLRPHFADVL